MTWTIRVPKWDKFQHYKDRSPTWIKLYRELLNRRSWRDLSGPAAKLLVDVWLLAAESKDGKITLPLPDIAWRLRLELPDMLADLQTLQGYELVEVAPHDASAPVATVPTALAQRRDRAEGETETIASQSGAAPPPESTPDNGKGGNPMAVLGPLIRDHLYHDGKPPEGYNPKRCGDICNKLVASGRYTVDDLREAILVIPRLRAGKVPAEMGLRQWFAKQGTLTMRVLVDRWGSGLVLDQLLHVVRKAESRGPTPIRRILGT